MVCESIWLSIVAETEALPAAPEVGVNTDVAEPEVVVVEVGLSDPKVAPKDTGVPSGTVKPVWLMLFLVMLAVSVALWPEVSVDADEVNVMTRNGELVTFPKKLAAGVLMPNQLLAATTELALAV